MVANNNVLSPRETILNSIDAQVGRTYSATDLTTRPGIIESTGMTDYFEVRGIPKEVKLEVLETAIQQYYAAEGFQILNQNRNSIFFKREDRQTSVELTYDPSIGLLIVSSFDRDFTEH